MRESPRNRVFVEHLLLIGFGVAVFIGSSGCSLPFRAANAVVGTVTRTTMGAAKTGSQWIGKGAGAAVSAARAYPYYRLFGISPDSVVSEEPPGIP